LDDDEGNDRDDEQGWEHEQNAPQDITQHILPPRMPDFTKRWMLGYIGVEGGTDVPPSTDASRDTCYIWFSGSSQ
jgi:hypothetical protein